MGFAPGHIKVSGRTRTEDQALSLSLHPTLFPSSESRNLKDIISPQQMLRFGEQWTKALHAPILDVHPQARRDSSHSPGAASALTPSLDRGLPGNQAPDPHSCCQGLRGLSPAQVLAVSNPHCLLKPPGHSSDLWGGPRELGLPGTSVQGRNLTERGGRGQRDSHLLSSYWEPGMAPNLRHMLSQFILPTLVCMGRMTLSLR